ncbi:argininosuccinate lyase [Gemmobacter aquaticus]|nr:argininosuccinate lyase [Gemmobacter aquaticus]
MRLIFPLTLLGLLAACGADGAPEAPAAPGITISGDARAGVVGTM